jgi:hypothetical protein
MIQSQIRTKIKWKMNSYFQFKFNNYKINQEINCNLL